MAGKALQLFPDPLITKQSMAASFNGTPTNIQVYDNVGIQLSWSGADPLGTINVQVSLDYDPRFPSGGVWTLLQDPSGNAIKIQPTGSAGNGYFDLNQLSAPWIQVVYTTASSSSGLLTSKIIAKAV